MGRMASKHIRPRLIISEIDGRWTLKTETQFKTMIIDFIEGIEYEERTGDGRELTVRISMAREDRLRQKLLQGIVRFNNGIWTQTMKDKQGKQSLITRWIDDHDQQQIVTHVSLRVPSLPFSSPQVLECGQVKASRVYRRV
jgi:hypothetical protein